MLLKLRKYNFTLKFKKRSELHIVDTLSRTCTETAWKRNELENELEEEIYLVNLHFDVTDSKLKQTILETENGNTLKQVKEFIKNDWLKDIPEQLK